MNKIKILIAEDNENSRILLESLLDANGYLVNSAENGRVALESALNDTPDMIISDIMMPEMDGYALCKKIKADPVLKKIPFIFYTATFTSAEDKKLAEDIGVSRFIIKPAEVDKFLEEIEEVLLEHAQNGLNHGEPVMEEVEIEKEYSEVLARKLEKKVAELEEEKIRLKHSENKYRCLVEALRDDYVFFTHTPDLMFSYVSPSMESVLGYDVTEFRNGFINFLTNNSINANILDILENSVLGDKQEPYEIEIFHKNGTIRRLEITEQPIFDDNGRLEAVEGIAHDITERVRSQVQLARALEGVQHSEKVKALGTLAGGIAHDFNNILTPIIGYSEITVMDLDDRPRLKANLKEVLAATARAKELVNQILTFSRQSEDTRKVIYPQTVVTEALKLIRASVPSTIKIKAELCECCKEVMANPTQLHQIMMNLCTNAYHAMKDTGGDLKIIVDSYEFEKDTVIRYVKVKKGEYVRIVVEDSGVGINDETMKKIFDPYFTTKPQGEGTGLGLSVVHGIVTSHEGLIDVESEEGKGTRFTIYLPVYRMQKSRSAFSNIEEIMGGHEKILFVDDEEVIGRIVKKQLESLGYQVVYAHSGDEAVHVFDDSTGNFDLVLTDFSMPDMTGLELSKELIARKPDLNVIMCSGISSDDIGDKAAAAGIKKYLMKPVRRRELALAIRNTLD